MLFSTVLTCFNVIYDLTTELRFAIISPLVPSSWRQNVPELSTFEPEMTLKRRKMASNHVLHKAPTNRSIDCFVGEVSKSDKSAIIGVIGI